MRAFARFYCLCFGRAFPGAWSAAWISSSLATIIGGAIAIFRPFEAATMNLLVGLIPLAIFVGIMIAGPLIASYRINKELQDENQQLKARLEPRVDPVRQRYISAKLEKLKPDEIAALKLLLATGGLTHVQLVNQCGVSPEELFDKTGFLKRIVDDGRFEVKDDLKEDLKRAL